MRTLLVIRLLALIGLLWLLFSFSSCTSTKHCPNMSWGDARAKYLR